jgi:uncharacterized protein YceK
MRTRQIVVFGAVLLTLSGCASIRRHEAASTEQLLAAAGFRMQPADNPERVHDLEAMPSLKLVARSQAGDVRYTFADPYKCHCLYVGGAKEYSAYQRLVTEKQIEQERLWAEEDAMNWALWGPWYW